MSMSSESLTKEDFLKDKQDVCYDLAVAGVQGLEHAFGIEFDSQAAHALHGNFYDDCMGY